MSKQRKSPEESATLYKIGIKKKGNDGNTWIITENKNGVKRWKLYEQTVEKTSNNLDLTKLNNFGISRNGSEMIGNKSQICNLDLINKLLYIKISSKYIIEADNQEIIIYLKNCYINGPYSLKNLNRKVWIKIYFFNDDIDKNLSSSKSNKDIEIYYSIYFYTMNKTLLSFIYDMEQNNKLKSNQLSKYIADDSMKITKEHHYGELIRGDIIINNLQKGKRYYIVIGQSWRTDYTGKYSIYILEYDGYVLTKNNGTHYDIKGKMYDKKSFVGENIYDEKNKFSYFTDFTTGSGMDPVHFITKWRKGFTPPTFKVSANLYIN